MTSSLVGSEMCIRDRRRGGRSASRERRARGTTQTSGPSVATTVYPPVSYTHLTLPTICSV
eukprot:10841488-Prorocentrum_lima.AAC.1